MAPKKRAEARQVSPGKVDKGQPVFQAHRDAHEAGKSPEAPAERPEEDPVPEAAAVAEADKASAPAAKRARVEFVIAQPLPIELWVRATLMYSHRACASLVPRNVARSPPPPRSARQAATECYAAVCERHSQSDKEYRMRTANTEYPKQLAKICGENGVGGEYPLVARRALPSRQQPDGTGESGCGWRWRHVCCVSSLRR